MDRADAQGQRRDMRVFRDRYEAGRLLGDALAAYADTPDVVVLGLARGGVPIAHEIAHRLRAPFDVCIVRKLGVPGQEELAMGAVAAGGPVVVNGEITESLGIREEVVEQATRRERSEIDRREWLYRNGHHGPDLKDRTVILVDDGLATGATMTAAVLAVQNQKPARVVVAVPVASASTADELKQTADEVICLEMPDFFFAVGHWYSDFSPTTDEEVRELLSGASRRTMRQDISIPVTGQVLKGDLVIPAGANGLVLFAHGAGSGRHSPRNQLVAHALREAGLGTLLMDLLTDEEELSERSTGTLRFDIELLAARLMDATEWVSEQQVARDLPIGYFGASTGAAAALVAAAERPEQIGAVVSRGGRPDLAGAELSRVRAPTLLIVGGADPLVLELNREALRELDAPKSLEVVAGATHLFGEPGTLERVAELSCDWFEEHLREAHSGPRRSKEQPLRSTHR